jgi:hypothetical protein
MRRALLAVLLGACLTVGGCASRRQSEAAQAAAELGLSPNAQRCCQYPDWLDNHPIAKGSAYAAYFLGLWAMYGIASLPAGGAPGGAGLGTGGRR